MTPKDQQHALVEAHFSAVVKRDGMKLFQQPAGTEGYRGMDLSGLWIMQRADGTFYGTNFSSESECYTGNLQDFSKRYDYLKDRNATFDAARDIGEPVIKAMRFWLFQICGEMMAHHATAAQETESILRALTKWIP